jgi:hypothetical protein
MYKLKFRQIKDTYSLQTSHLLFTFSDLNNKRLGVHNISVDSSHSKTLGM